MDKNPKPSKKTYPKENTDTRLYPQGTVKKAQLDSLRKANPILAQKLGKPISTVGRQSQYGEIDSDMIKAALKGNKK